MRHVRTGFVYLLLAGCAAWCAVAFRADLGRLSFVPLARAWDAVLLAALLSLLNYALRVLRWRSFASRLGYAFTPARAALVYLSGFAFTLVPGKVGEMARARYCAPEGMPVGAVAATFFLERLVDALAMAALAALALPALGAHRSVVGLALGAAVLGTAVLGALSRPQWLRPLEARLAGGGRIRAALRGAVASLLLARGLLRPRLLIASLVIAVLAWGAEGVGFGVLTALVPPERTTWAVAVGIYAVAVLVGAISFLPGGLGSTEAVMGTLLVAQGYSGVEAVLVTIVCRVLTLWLAVGLGWLAVFLLGRRAPVAVPSWR
jgi:uncharacterized membrane protein YbhN (UPF0104 family)